MMAGHCWERSWANAVISIYTNAHTLAGWLAVHDNNSREERRERRQKFSSTFFSVFKWVIYLLLLDFGISIEQFFPAFLSYSPPVFSSQMMIIIYRPAFSWLLVETFERVVVLHCALQTIPREASSRRKKKKKRCEKRFETRGGIYYTRRITRPPFSTTSSPFLLLWWFRKNPLGCCWFSSLSAFFLASSSSTLFFLFSI